VRRGVRADRAHQISVGGFADLPRSFRASLISHFYSPLSTTLFIPNTGLGAGEIFRTDFTGEGRTGDPLPGTRFGNFDRGIKASNLNHVLSNYNQATALQLTPAGEVLVRSGLFTSMQMGVGNSLCYENPTTCSLIRYARLRRLFRWHLKAKSIFLG
jgi:hypothetical protein